MGQVCCNARKGKAGEGVGEEGKAVKLEEGRSRQGCKLPRKSRPRMKTLITRSRILTRTSVSRQHSETKITLKGELETKGTDNSIQSTVLINPNEDLSYKTELVTDKELEVTLLQIEKLSEDVRDRLSDLITLQSRNYVAEEEELEGYIPADITLENQSKQKKLVVVSNFSIYIIDASSLRMEEKIGLQQIQLVSVSPEKTLCLIHYTSSSICGDLLIESNYITNLLPGLELIYNELTRKYIPCITLDSTDVVRKRFNTITSSSILSYHTAEYEQITSIFIRNGEIGENKVFFRRTKLCFPGMSEETGYVLLSNLAVYLIQDDFLVREKHDLETLMGVTLSQTTDQLMLHTRKGDRLLTLSNSFTEFLEKAIFKRSLPKLSVVSKISLDVGIAFRKVLKDPA